MRKREWEQKKIEKVGAKKSKPKGVWEGIGARARVRMRQNREWWAEKPKPKAARVARARS